MTMNDDDDDDECEYEWMRKDINENDQASVWY
jgi:hypothetical protein